jgi:hypothetical protein
MLGTVSPPSHGVNVQSGPGRFSDATGIPTVPDGADVAEPHGMAITFHLPNGSDTDMVINSLKFFPVAAGEELRDLLLALAASPPDAARPDEIRAIRGQPSFGACRVRYHSDAG